MKEKMILEQAREIPVVDEADVVVVGGGSAGSAAAIAAARAGAKTILIERYGYLGGMPTGGEVILIPSLSSGDTVMIKGVMLELMTRLEGLKDGVCGPDRSLAGRTDEETMNKWKDYFNMVWRGSICYGGYVHPDLLKIAINELMEDAGVNLYLHSLGCKTIVEGSEVKGVYFESKDGRSAILAKQVIDCTGDGDVFASAGAEYDVDRSSLRVANEADDVLFNSGRTASLAVVYRLGGADFKKHAAYRRAEPEKWAKQMDMMNKIAGYPMMLFPTNRNDVVWSDNWILGYSSLKAKDLTSVEMLVRRTMLDVIDYINSENIPGLENVWLYDVAPQIGTRGSRRVRGEYCMTMKDVCGGSAFDDVIAVFPSTVRQDVPLIPTEIPLRSLIAKNLDNLFVAGRCYSSDLESNAMTNLVPHCFAMGQAAGAAAAVAARDGSRAADVDVKAVQKILLEQDVYLPERICEELK